VFRCGSGQLNPNPMKILFVSVNASRARQAGPGPIVEHRPGLGCRRVDVCRAGVGDLGDHLA